jgi:hypothetical protein
MVAVADINELRGNPQPVVGFSDTALENRFYIQILSDIADIFRLAFVSERGSAGGDSNTFHFG